MCYNEIMEKLFTFREYADSELQNLSVATLAWIGDAVYTCCIREFLLEHHRAKPNTLHRLATRLVNAEAQSEALETIKDRLDTEEAGVVRRAKNSPITTKSKHYGLAEYRRATALEALIGYLYLSGRHARLNELLAAILQEVRE